MKDLTVSYLDNSHLLFSNRDYGRRSCRPVDVPTPLRSDPRTLTRLKMPYALDQFS